MDATTKLKFFQNNTLGFVFLLALSLLCGLCAGSCPPNDSNSMMPYLEKCDDEDGGSGGDFMMMLSCPEPDCISLTVNGLETITVNFGIMCLPVLSTECQYNFTVKFYTPSQDILLGLDSRVLSYMELNQTSFNVTPLSLREGAESFEMGVVVVVTISNTDGETISRNETISGDFAPSIFNLTVSEVRNTSIGLAWDLPYPQALPDSYQVFYSYRELSGADPRTGSESIYVATTSTTVTDLLPFSMYNISVATVYSGALSRNITTNAQTEEGVSSPVTDLMVKSNIMTMMFIISWNKPRFPAGVIDQYLISVIQEQQNIVLNLTVFSMGLQVTAQFMFFLEYTISIVPVNGFGPGETSDVTMTTSPEGAPTPPMSFTLQQVSGSSTTLTASWNQPSTLNGILTNYSVFCRVASEQFYSEQEPSIEESFSLQIDPDNITTTITDLEAFTSYDCYVTASTNGGESEPSNSDTARTDEDTPSAPVNFTYTDITATSVTLDWRRPNTPNGIITEYLLQFTNSSSLEITIPVVFNRTSNEYNVTSLLVEYLNEDTMYTVNISAITGGGGGPEATIDIRTREAAPSATPLNLAGINTSSTSLLISWSPPPLLDQNGVILGYNISYFSSDDDSMSETTTETMMNITGLSVFTVYNVSVAAHNSAGTGPFDSITVRTDSAPPFAPMNLTVRTLNSTSLSVSWENPLTVRGIREGFLLRYMLIPQDLFLLTNYTPFDLEVGRLQLALSDLHEFAGYTVLVQALNDKGLGDVSVEVGMTDQSAPSAGVRNVSVDVLDSTTVNVSWLPPPRSDWNGLITDYNVSYTSNDSSVPSLLSGMVSTRYFRNGNNPRNATDPLERESVLVSNLEEFITYQFTVNVSTVIGTNPEEDTPPLVEVRTDESAPSAPPLDVTVTVLSALTANITWAPPPYIDRNGIIVSYSVRISACLGRFPSPIDTNDTYYLATDLPQFAEFSVQVSAATSRGLGPYSPIVTEMTLEGLPSGPRNVVLNENNETSITVEWVEPELPNGIIQGYYIFYFGVKDNGDSFTGLNENLTVMIPGNATMTHLLTGLLSDTTYSVNVTAFTTTGNGTTGIGGSVTLPAGQPPTPGSNFTISTPSTDQPGEEDVVTDTTIRIEFTLPEALNSNGRIQRVRIIIRAFGSFNDTLDTYWFSFRADPPNVPPYFALEVSISDLQKRGLVKRQANGEEMVSETIGAQSGCGPADRICNGPLRPDTEYEFKYRAYNSDDDNSFAESTYSPPISTASSPSSSGNGVVVAAVVIVLILVLIIVIALIILIIVLYYRRRRLRKYSFKGNGTSDSLLHSKDSATLTKSGTLNTGPTIVPLSENVILKNKSAMRATSIKATPHSRKVYLRDLPGYVRDMMSDSGFKFSEEYEKVSAIGLDHSKDASLMPENRAKNRYTNILAYDHSRVKLDYVDDDPGSDYINANYIPGYRVRRAYIATQGPLPSTFDDFWTMIWEQNVHNIVMLTQLVERGRTKCHRYWPGSQPEVYGDIAVEMSSEKELNDWIIRTFELKKEKRIRTIYHYQFTSWPDHGVPEAATAALDFVRSVHENIQSMHGPVVVHCSAGVGRTGTFIALGTILQHIKDHDWIDIFGLACEMRQHRNHMIQTEAQYIFIHKSMVEVCESLSTFSVGKMQSFNPIYVNIGIASPVMSQQSDTMMFGTALLSEEVTHSQLEKAYQESKF